MMSMVDLIAMGVETSIIDSGCSLEEEFTKLIYMNLLVVLYLTINQFESYHICVCDPLI